MTDQLRPPGYYVATPHTCLCAHCGADPSEHTGPRQYCPRPPLELRGDALRGAA